jgi:molybdate transport system substrate-binding protein
MRPALLLIAILIALPIQAAEPLRVAVAANFKATLAKLNPLFEQQYKHRVTLSSASTGTLYNQIVHGAPFDILLAADVDTPGRLLASGQAVAGTGICYARGQLVLVGGSSLSQLANPQRSLVIANPVTAPYGRAALAVIERDEFHTGSTRKLVRGNNVAQALQFWQRGGIDMALLPASLSAGQGLAIPTDWYPVLDQQAVLLRRATDSPAASDYLRWLGSDSVQSLIEQAGYTNCL